ncbi:DNA polymerase III subunit alpha [Dysgonomonas sp. 25]|uniref:DNA polymerase III subunit alpha n=1 Tax=Dysgonomonas sp. 25 TaxID=2302933 RepID=UPI0013D59D33|nr:DNA polymerase III subunit alpha [Dysgonomonas sp. 25]NDV68151.1 DNA polymerase III subunit alpha [Dysgonomonas sp. 25]
MANFVHLHVHSQYSLLDGQASIQKLVDKAHDDGMRALALTDHGAMFGVKEFYNYVKKKNSKVEGAIKELKAELKKLDASAAADKDAQIDALKLKIIEQETNRFKPIIGCECYVARRARKLKEGKPDMSGWHLVVLAKNKQGYKNLIKMVSVSWTEGYYMRPRIDKELLEKYHEGLIVSSACLGGEIPKKIQAGDTEEVDKAIEWFKNLFGDDFYLELQRHETTRPDSNLEAYPLQQKVNAELIRLAEKHNVKLIATNDVHFVNEEDADAHDRLICLSTGKDLDDPKRMRYTKQEWLKTTAEMNRIFADVPQALANTLEIADKVEYYSIDSDALMPFFTIDESFGTEAQYKEKFAEADLIQEFGEQAYNRLGGYDKVIRIKLEADYLRYLTEIGANKRYGAERDEELTERIEFELETMKTMGFPGYFLIVQDFIAAAREMGVSVGPGRGSAAGSVVAYCLGITDIDPIKYDLLFERFLNPDRISMPDIDIDFDDDGRGKVLDWVTQKYGKERVAHIITYGTMATKSAIKDVARVQKLPLAESNRLAKYVPDRIPDKKKVTLKDAIEYVPELKEAAVGHDPIARDTLKYAQMLEGNVRNTGVHACGIIIGQQDISDVVPVSTAEDKETGETMLVTQYEGSVIEETGLIKMDFLGLKTLSIIKEAIDNIKDTTGEAIDIDNISLEDPKTYELYSQGKTTGTFQFESAGMQKYLKELQPTKFEDLIAMNALYRPGPMDYIPSFIARKHGREEITYDIPIMERYLEDTYGITVYQEQVMLLSRLLANFTRGQSDELRKAMGKKLIDKMNALKEKFLAGGAANGHDKKVLEKIWADWEKFASYAFNKSHATCYSWVAYQTAWLKANYPSEYMAATLSRNLSNITEITKFMDECKAMDINVLGPDVNESVLKFSVNKEGHIRFGMAAIKGVGEGAVASIIAERTQNGPFKSIFDFVERVSLSSCNKKNIESLALAGAFDNFAEITREQFFGLNSKGETFIDQLIRYGNKFQTDRDQAQNSLFGGNESVEIAHPEIPKVERWSDLERLGKERDLIGIYLSAHPLDEYSIVLNYVCNMKMSELEDKDAFKNKEVKLGGLVTGMREGFTKNGKPFMIIKVEDFTGSGELPLFGDDYVNFGKYGRPGLYLFIRGRVQPRRYNENEFELKINTIDLLPNVKDKLIEKITIQLPLHEMNKQIVEELSLLTKNNPGNSLLYFEVIDGERNMKVDLFSRSIKVDVKKELIDYITDSENLLFKIN